MHRRGSWCQYEPEDPESLYWNCGAFSERFGPNVYISIDGECWDEGRGSWLQCDRIRCEYDPKASPECEYWQEDTARREDGDRLSDFGEDVKDMVEDWAEDFARSQQDRVRNITENAEAILEDLHQNLTSIVNATIANVTAELRNASNETAAWAQDNLTEEDMHKLLDEAVEEVARELDLGMLQEAEHEESNSATVGLVAAGVVATAAGLFVARRMSHKGDDAFERV